MAGVPSNTMNYSSLRILGDLTVAPGGEHEALGPAGVFKWDKATLYNSGYGMKNGQRVYKSVNQSADGAGGLTYWYRYYQNGEWIIARNTTTAHLRFVGGTGNTVCTPKFTFPSGTVQYIVEGGATGFLTSEVEANFALGEGNVVHFICSNWDAITQIDLNTDKLAGDITHWQLPANLTRLYLDTNQLTGDITHWQLPANLTRLYLDTNQLTGDITHWQLPANLEHLYLNANQLTGDITHWQLPANMTRLSLHANQLTGDITHWQLPANLALLYLRDNTGLGGDFSRCTTGTKLQYVTLYNTSITYGFTGGPFSIITDVFRSVNFDNCLLPWSHVDNVLADLVTSGVTNAVSSKNVGVGDNNDAPSEAGLASKATLEGRGWTVKVRAA